MLSASEEIDYALDILGLPKLITKDDIRKQYHFLAKKNHPDLGGDEVLMEQINTAYTFLMKYIEEFTDGSIVKQHDYRVCKQIMHYYRQSQMFDISKIVTSPHALLYHKYLDLQSDCCNLKRRKDFELQLHAIS